MNCHQLTLIEGDWRNSSERIEFVIINKHSGRSDGGSRNCKFFNKLIALPLKHGSTRQLQYERPWMFSAVCPIHRTPYCYYSVNLVFYCYFYNKYFYHHISISNNTLCLPTAKTSYYLQEYILNFFCVDHFSVTFGIESRFFEVQTQTNFTFTALSPTSLCQNTTLWKRTPAFQLYSPLEL